MIKVVWIHDYGFPEVLCYEDVPTLEPVLREAGFVNQVMQKFGGHAHAEFENV